MSLDVKERPADILVNADPAPIADTSKRRQILDGARRIFLSRGFDGASMGEIARAAGVSKGTIYVYFDSKEALFEALTLEERCGLAEALFAMDEFDPDVEAVLRRLGHSFIEVLARPEHISSVRMVIGAADQFPRFGRLFYEAGPATGSERLAAYLTKQVAIGRLAIDDVALAASQFLELCASALLKRLLFAVEVTLDPTDVSRRIDGAVRMFMATYGGQTSSRSAAAIRD